MPGEVEVNRVGFSTVEAVPLFHYKPGSIVMRILAYPSKWPLKPCSLPYEPCDWLTAPRSFARYLVDIRVLGELRARWKAEATVVDGAETWRFAEGLAPLKPLIARTQLAVKPPSSFEGLDALVVDLTPGWSPEDLASVISAASRSDVWVEVNLYLEAPEPREPERAAEALKGTETPLHVHLVEHKGGGAVSRLYARLRGKHWPVYIHVDTYWELDTACPRCGAYVATRHPYYLVSLSVKPPSRCYSCGAPIPFKPPLRRKTDEMVRRMMPTSTYWVDPEFIGGRPVKA